MTGSEQSGDKPLRTLMWLNAALACVLLALAAASYWYGAHRQLFSETPSTVLQKIAETQDIEHLRKLALLIAQSDNRMAPIINGTFSRGIRAFADIVLVMGFLFGVNVIALLKYRRAAAGRPVKWLGKVW